MDSPLLRSLSGLAKGDRIVIDGADKLRDGAKVIVRSEAAASPPADAAKGRPAQDGPGNGGKKRRSDGGQKQ